MYLSVYIIVLFWFFQNADTKKSCRLDWFQTGPNVNISVFAKVAVPDKTVIEVNQVVCKMSIVFEGGKSVYEHKLILRNVSSVVFKK